MTAPRQIVVFGGTGQIGREIVRKLSSWSSVVAPSRGEVDLASIGDTRAFLRSAKPEIVVNAAAYTDVDRAESDAAVCARINAEAPAVMAEECRRLGAVLIHFSTDYVFDGEKRTPYVETDAMRPLGVYGRSKRDGDDAVAAMDAYVIFRTSWTYASRGRNFPSTILRLAREREELTVVDDQIGAPTSASAVATAVNQVLRSVANEPELRAAAANVSGVYHLSAAGSTTWFAFARHIVATDPRAAEHVCRAVRPIRSGELFRPAARPAYSVLDNTKIAARFGVQLPSWVDQWRTTVEEMRLAESAAT